MDFQEYLKTSAEEINKELDLFFQKWSEEVKAVSPKLVNLNKAFIRANIGGKRLRGALVKLGYKMANGKNNPEILKPAAAYEVFQTSILAHDDIIDLADLRRGEPTLYKTLGGDHYGISQTICLGDIGFFLAVKLIAEAKFPEDCKNKALAAFAEMFTKTGLGEMLDIELPYLKQKRLEEDVLTIHRLKTADYTIVYPLTMGALLGRATPKLIDQITKFGEALGIAFQIQDDILGVFGDEKTLGKSVTSDIEEGKNTLLIIYALSCADLKQKAILKKYYGRGKIGQNKLGKIRKTFIETGALDYSKKKAEKLVAQAKIVIKKMNISQKYKDLLFQMANFLVSRDK